jgi:hypothetical protein
MRQVFIPCKNADRRPADQLSEGLEAAGYVTLYYDRDRYLKRQML